MKPGAFMKAIDDERIVAAIREAEARSRGEIRVHVAEGASGDSRAEAARVFERLGMVRTEERNGVLIFVAPESRKVAIVGDRDIDARCGEAFWTRVVGEVRGEFQADRFTEGLVAAVRAVGDELARHFPREAGETDPNELPDAVSRG